MTPIEHASPTKALFQSRLNNDITSLTAWLEILHAPDPIPRQFLAWRDEVLQQSSQLHIGIVGVGQTGVELGSSSVASISTSASFGNDAGGGSSSSSKILDALKALKQANLLADHLRALVHDARVEELEVMEKHIAHVARQREEGMLSRVCVDEICAALEPDAKMAFEQLENAAVLLQVPLGGISHGYGGHGHSVEMERGSEDDSQGVLAGSDLMSVFWQQMQHYAHHRFVLEDQVERLHVLNNYMHGLSDGNMAAADSKGPTKLLKEVESGPVTVEDIGSFNRYYHDNNEQLQAETANFTRDAKLVNLKVLEYHERIVGLQKKLSKLRDENASVEDVLNTRKRVEQRAAGVEELERRLRNFHGLPPELAASRDEIKRAALELEECKRRREDLFGRITNLDK